MTLPVSASIITSIWGSRPPEKSRRFFRSIPIEVGCPSGATGHRVLIWSPRESMARSEEHTSELQSLRHLVCRLLLEKKKNKIRGIKLVSNPMQAHATQIETPVRHCRSLCRLYVCVAHVLSETN